MNIIGWQPILPQLAVYFACRKITLTDEDGKLIPNNLFLHGRPGTNKTKGANRLCHLVDIRAHMIDCSVLDDVSELLGTIDLRANIQESQNRMIENQRLKKDTLILDELPNTKPRVMDQMHLVLQGFVEVNGEEAEINAKTFIATGNLSDDMEEGDANILNSPMADRFALVVRVPSLGDMEKKHVLAILERRADDSFETELKEAVASIDRHFAEVKNQCGGPVSEYVASLATQLKGALSFQGRRGQLLRTFVLAGLALSRGNKKLDQKDVIFAITRDCLSYHLLSGLVVNESDLRSAFELAYAQLGDLTIDSLIAGEKDLAKQVELLVAHRDVVVPLTKADVFGKVVESGPADLQLACIELFKLPAFKNEPAELKALTERIQNEALKQELKLTPEHLDAVVNMSHTEALAYQMCGGSKPAMTKLMAKVYQLLEQWGVAGGNSGRR